MTASQKQQAFQEIVTWLMWRKGSKSRRTVTRNAIQAYYEAVSKQITGVFEIKVLEATHMNSLAQAVGGVYIIDNGKGSIKY
jgi:hypothetical protein